MARFQVFGHKFETAEERFTQSDQKNWSSGVRALPVAAGTNEGGHYFRYFSPSCWCCYSPCFYTRRDCRRILNFCMGKKADFGRKKAKMGRFSQKGLCYSFEILHGLLSYRKNNIPIRKKIETPLPPAL